MIGMPGSCDGVLFAVFFAVGLSVLTCDIMCGMVYPQNADGDDSLSNAGWAAATYRNCEQNCRALHPSTLLADMPVPQRWCEVPRLHVRLHVRLWFV